MGKLLRRVAIKVIKDIRRVPSGHRKIYKYCSTVAATLLDHEKHNYAAIICL